MNLPIIEQNNQRVLTTQQLAEAFGSNTDKVNYNFNYNKERYKVGKHYFLLQGEELKNFKEANHEFQGSINKLYLWTEKGAWLHAKSLNTDEAWEAYEKLVDDYYEMGSQINQLEGLSPQLQLLINIEMKQKEQDSRIALVEQKQEQIQEVVALNSLNWRRDANVIMRKIAMAYGGDAEAYREVANGIYKEVDRRGQFSLERRLINKRRRMADEGISKSKREKLNYLDVIADDKKLIEIFIAIVKETAIRNQVDASQLETA